MIDIESRRENSTKIHFKIQLSPLGKPPPHGQPLIDHQVRQTPLHPKPSLNDAPKSINAIEISMRHGFTVTQTSRYQPAPMKYTFNSDRSPLLFAYVLQGSRCFTIKNRADQVETRAGHWYVGFIPEVEGRGVIMGSPMLRSIKLRFDPLVLYELLEGEIAGLPSSLATLLSRLEAGVITIGGRMSSAMATVVEQVLRCPSDTNIQRFSLESKVLDLLSVHLQELYDGRFERTGMACSRGNKALAAEARHILISSLPKPTSLDRIAARLGVSGLTLKRTFEAEFGVSLDRYAQIQRMETARRFLEQGDMNVNEVAGQIGYSNVSRFIDAFHRAHGVKPGAFMRQNRFSRCLDVPVQHPGT